MLGKGTVGLEDSDADWKGVKATKYGNSLAGTGQVRAKLTGKISPSHKIKGYASWTWINIFAGSEPGDYDYCATGGRFHGKRISKKVRAE